MVPLHVTTSEFCADDAGDDAKIREIADGKRKDAMKKERDKKVECVRERETHTQRQGQRRKKGHK